MTDKSVITCDLEGRIETFNEGAQAMFGWAADDVIGKKRVSAFSPGLVVLGHVGQWLATAVKEGKSESRTVFIRKDGSPFAADIKITPTFKDGRQVGYCGVTVARPDVEVEDAMPKLSVGTRLMSWMVVTRAPFLTAVIVPVLLAGAYVAMRAEVRPFPWSTFALALLGGIFLHIAANTFNDYFDWTSGTDQGNNEYFLPFSGGSRSIELGLITQRGLFAVATVALVSAALIGLVLLRHAGLGLVWFGLAGAFSAIFYTAPPLRLAARRGLGELLIGLNFGPLVTGGVAYVLTGTVTRGDFVVGLPVGLLTTAILWINEFPDAPSDARAGKNHLVVTLGLEAARWGYLALVVAAFGLVAVGVAVGHLPWPALAMLLAIPLAARSTRILWRHYRDRELVKATATTVQLQLVAGLLLTVGLLAQTFLR